MNYVVKIIIEILIHKYNNGFLYTTLFSNSLYAWTVGATAKQGTKGKVKVQCPTPKQSTLERTNQVLFNAIGETGWDSGALVAVLQCLHLNTSLLQQRNTKKPYRLKNNYMHAAAGSHSGQKIQTDQKTQLLLWRTQSNGRVLYMPPAHNST